MSRSSRCIGTGGRLKPEPQLVDPRLDAVAAGARRIDRQALGLVDHDRFAVDEQDAVFKVHGRVIAMPKAKQSNLDKSLVRAGPDTDLN